MVIFALINFLMIIMLLTYHKIFFVIKCPNLILIIYIQINISMNFKFNSKTFKTYLKWLLFNGKQIKNNKKIFQIMKIIFKNIWTLITKMSKINYLNHLFKFQINKDWIFCLNLFKNRQNYKVVSLYTSLKKKISKI